MPKLFVPGVCNRTPEDINRCIDYTKSLWLPWLQPPQGADWRPLAILGGGPSINEHIDELKGWPGDIWAINESFKWCKVRGINAAFFTIDPETYKHVPHPTFEWVEKGDMVIIAPRVPGVLVDHCIAVDADIRLFELQAYVTAATWALRLSAVMGRADVTLFGCESSYKEGGPSHAHGNQVVNDRILVESNGEEFLTKPELLHQAMWLSEIIRACPNRYREKSGGLLRALVASGDHDVLKVPRWLNDMMVHDGALTRLWKQSRQALVDLWKRGLGAPRHAGHRPGC